MTSHTHFYKKLDEFGKDYNLKIKEKVKQQGKLMAQGTINITTIITTIIIIYMEFAKEC